jgi:hypothetical protein
VSDFEGAGNLITAGNLMHYCNHTINYDHSGTKLIRYFPKDWGDLRFIHRNGSLHSSQFEFLRPGKSHDGKVTDDRVRSWTCQQYTDNKEVKRGRSVKSTCYEENAGQAREQGQQEKIAGIGPPIPRMLRWTRY